MEGVVKTRGSLASMDPKIHWEWVRSQLREAFDVDPIWLPIIYSNRSLAPWQAGATWTQGTRLVSIQLREAFRKGTFLGIYQREDVLAHEAVHGVRASLESEKWEEFFAYMVAGSRVRRFLGPLIQRPWEVWPFLGLSFLGALLLGPFPSLAAGWAGLGVLRLLKNRFRLRRAAREVGRVIKGKREIRAFLFRLKDEEIDQLAKGISLKALAEKNQTLRWQILKEKRIGTDDRAIQG